MGFRVGGDKRTIYNPPGKSIRELLHFSLDRILDEIMETGSQLGGEGTLNISCSGFHEDCGRLHQLRLTVAEFTDEQLCSHCGGTGAEPSKPDDPLNATEVGEE